MKVKACLKCSQIKGICEFPLSKQRSGNLIHISYCKQCKYLMHKNWLDRSDNRNRMKEKRKKWSEDNKEHETAKKRNYVALNRDKVKKIKKEWDEKNKDHVREYAKELVKKLPIELIRKWQRKSQTKRTETLHDCYIKSTLKVAGKQIKASEITSEMIELKRNQLKLHRLTKNK